MSHLTATLSEGDVRGMGDRRFPQVLRVCGLPYAAPPVGVLRFAPPVPCARSDSWSPLDVSRLGSEGPALREAARLTVDVWAPAEAQDRPVLVWFDHDEDADPAGRGGVERFCASLAAEEGIVVVAPRHRTGALGYLDLTSLREGHGNGNFGLLDQMEALTWVATHARAFGGDPTTLTVSGRGAGAHVAALLAGLPRTSPLVRRVVLPNGAPPVRVQTPEQGARVAAAFLDRLGADPAARGELRAVDAEAIARAESALGRPGGRSPFGLVAHDEMPLDDLTEMLRGAVRATEVLVVDGGVEGAGTPGMWTLWRCGEDRAAERVSAGALGRPGVPGEGRPDLVGAFVRTGDPVPVDGLRAEPLVRATAGWESAAFGVLR